MAADGSVIINTAIDTKGVKSGVADINKQIEKLAVRFEGLAVTMQKAMGSGAEKAAQMKAEIASLEEKTALMREELAALGKEQIATAEYQQLTEDIDRVNEQLNKYEERRARMLGTGVSKESQGWKNVEYDIRTARNELKLLLDEQKNMEAAGTAYTAGTNTAQYTQMESALMAAEAKLTGLKDKLNETVLESQRAAEATQQEAEARTEALRLTEAQKKAAQGNAQANQQAALNAQKLVKPTSQTAKNMSKTEKSTKGFGKKLKSLALSAFVFNVLSEGFRKLQDSIWGAISKTNEAKAAMANLKGAAYTAASPLIHVLSKAFAVLANTVATAFSYITQLYSLLSGKSLSAITETAKQMASVSEETENAAASAKKAQKSLAGFDELNIVSSNKDQGGSTTETPNYEYGLESGIVPYLETIAAKIKELIAPLQEISFQPAIKSLKKLWKAFQRLGKVIGDALEWAWTNILVPLAEWGIEEAAPAVIETLAEAFNMLAAVLEPVMAGINGLMDGLQPYIDLIKMQVLLYIDKWKERFRLLKETFEEHAPEIEGILENIGEGFEILWEIIGPVCEWIQQAWSDTTTYLSEEGAIGVGLLIDTFYGLTEFINGVFTGDWKRAWGGITTIFSSTSDAIGKSAAALEKATGIPFTKIYNSAKEKFNGVKEKVLGAWNSIKNSKTWTTIQTNLQSKWTALRTNATTKFNGIRDKVLSAWNTIRNSKTWSSISSSVTSTFSGMKKDVTSVFSGMKTSIVTTFSALKNALRTPINGIIRFLNKMISGIVDGINGAIKALNGLKFTVPSWVPGIGGRSMGLNIRTITKPTIPYLAKGAVIPPNAPFMAMLGDQRHGTNIEAPLSTIQEAVAAVIAEQFGDVAAGLFALVSGQQDILAAILSIEIGDTTIGQAAARYSRKMATARGGA